MADRHLTKFGAGRPSPNWPVLSTGTWRCERGAVQLPRHADGIGLPAAQRKPGMKTLRQLGLVLALAGTLTVPAVADEWPSRPVRILSTFAAGGAADVLARVVAEHLSTA